MTAPVQCTPTEATRLASLRTRTRGPKLTPEREQAILESILRTRCVMETVREMQCRQDTVRKMCKRQGVRI